MNTRFAAIFPKSLDPVSPHFRLHTVKGRLVNPHLDLDRTSALDVADDEEAFAPRRKH